jgi:general secretion pathway protein A
MYESFFGFNEKPFNITPDPKYLYLSDQHQEAIAHLHYGIDQRGGFVVITGEVGTGKTTLCRHLLNNMDDRTEGAIIFNPNLSEIELLKAINSDFGVDASAGTKKELIDELNRFLLEERYRGKNMVLMIDEAQNLLPVVLEQIRMLSNIETEKEKLIQIILIGQPQLKNLLARPELEQLSQRVTARYHLSALNRKETYRYIQHRLDVACNGSHIAFEPAAMRAIYKFSKGIPRLINVVCDRALLGAFTTGKQSPIPKKIVKQSIREVAGPKPSGLNRLSLQRTAVRLFLLPLAITLAAIVSWIGLTMFAGLRSPQELLGGLEVIPDAPVEQGAVSIAVPQPAHTAPTEPEAFAASALELPRVEPVAPVPPYTPEEKKALKEVLLSKSYEESRLTAGQGLLALWGKQPELALEDARSFHGLALSQKMRCTELWANLDGLKSANIPCMLEMFIPQVLRPRYAVLTSLGAENATILYGNGESLEVPLQLLDEFWLRRAFVFWQDFEDMGEILRAGDYGSAVVWLQSGLQSMGFYEGDPSGVFDDATEKSVRRFQQENNLLLDGVVGPKTRLVLYANLKQYSMPRLDGENI